MTNATDAAPTDTIATDRYDSLPPMPPDAVRQEQAELRAAIFDWRRTWGLSQGEVAERLAMHRTTIANWEKGETAIEHPQLVRFSYERLDEVIRAERQEAWDAEHATTFTRRILPYGQTDRDHSTHGAPVPDSLREAAGYLADLHGLVDRLEGQGQTATALYPSGLQALAEHVCQQCAMLHGRMRTIFGDEGSPPSQTDSPDPSRFAAFAVASRPG